MAFFQALSWHPGEDEIHRLTKVPPSDNPTVPMLTQGLARRITINPTIALGTTDKEGRVWCTVWGGDAPIAQQVARGGVIGVRAIVDASFDPVVEALYGGQTDGEVVQQDLNNAKMVSGLSIHLEDRDRVKLFGRMVAGCLNAEEDLQVESSSAQQASTVTDTPAGKMGNAQLVFHVTQALGNCPKYINKKSIKSYATAKPKLLSKSPLLSPEAVSHIHSADIIFVASRGPEDMDCNHRGGPPGFVRVQQPAKDSSTSSVLVWPEYSGNNLYQTLGNIVSNPQIGLVIPNFQTGTVLYVTGTAEVLVRRDASAVISKTNLAVRLTVTAARFVSDGLGFRGTPCSDNKDSSSSNPVVNREITDGMSPYNPRVRYLTTELADPTIMANSSAQEIEATLIQKQKITPTIMKYRFRLSSPALSVSSSKSTEEGQPLWQPGQYIALDFSSELDLGYSHMRDDDPTALNDDFIRTFTVSAPYVPPRSDSAQPEVEVTVRTVGTVTRWLSFQNERVGMGHVTVKGFAGDFRFENLPLLEGISSKKKNVFIAAGIGITPLLGQLPPLQVLGNSTDQNVGESLILLWTLQIRDINLASYVLNSATFPATLKTNTQLFVTGTSNFTEDSEEMKTMLKLESDAKETGVQIHRRRMGKEDLISLDNKKAREAYEVANWYLCTAPAMRKNIQDWLDGRPIIFENFDY